MRGPEPSPPDPAREPPSRDDTSAGVPAQKLREIEEVLRLLVDGVSEYAIYMLDPEGRVASWNAGAQRIKGYTMAEIIGQHVSRFYPPEDVAAGKDRRLLEEAARLGKVEDEGYRVRKGGMQFWANVVITALRDQTGRLRGYAKVTRDLTERREAEERQRDLIREQAARTAAEQAAEHLRRSEERHRTVSERLAVILDGVSDGITMQDRNGNLLFANDQAARLWGHASPEAMVAATAGDFRTRFALFDTDDRPLSHDDLPSRRVLDGDPQSSALIHVREKSTGRDWWSQVTARPVHDAEGGTNAVVTIWHDFTARRRREHELALLADAGALASSTLDHEAALGALADLMVPRLGDWCAISLIENGELRTLAVAHFDPEKIELARTLLARYPPLPNGISGVYQVIRTGRPELYPEVTDELLVNAARSPEHLHLLRSLGIKSAMIAPIAARDEAALGAILIASAESSRAYDKSDLALARELGRRAALGVENARLYKAAQDAIRVRDDFLSVAGHELKTPLAALQLQIQSLDRMASRGKLVTDEPRLRQRLSKTVALGTRLEELIRDLLDVSRIAAGRIVLEPQECNLSALVRDVVQRLEDQLAAAGCDTQIHGPDDIAGRWDRTQIERAMTNLVSNAMKYGRGKPIDITVEVAEGRARVSVRDQGIGIPPEDQARIFGRFERAVSERHYGGFGLGLWIVRKAVESHGGTVRLESKPGEGATFTIELPIAGSP